MKIQVQEKVDITQMTTFALPAVTQYFAIVKSSEDVQQAYIYAYEHTVPVFILGGGSNVVLNVDESTPCFVIKNEIINTKIISEDDNIAIVEIGAGVIWDDAVAFTVKHNLSGIEALSGIPGRAGSTPIQNVGAYGQEIKNVLVSVKVYDIANNKVVTLTNVECQFGYRDSFFKREGKGKYVILAITLRLSKKQPTIPNYPDVIKYFAEKNMSTPTLLQIRDAILHIRQEKLPSPVSTPSVGSFFKNPVVNEAIYEHLKKEYPTITSYPAGDGYFKLSAGWLIESLGMKGKSFGTVGLHHKNAIVMINNGGATYTDVCNLRDYVITKVEKVYGVKLDVEPVFFEG